MNLLVILCHPLPGSLNHATADRVVKTAVSAGHSVISHDLYAQKLDPVMSGAEYRRGFPLDETVQKHVIDLEAAEGLVIVHPDWWGGPPALLKGWLERVFRPGIAYEMAGEEFSRKTMAPLLTGRRALVLCTTDTDDEERGIALQDRWQNTILKPCGFDPVVTRTLSGVHTLSSGERNQWLKGTETTVTEWLAGGDGSGESGGPITPTA